MEYSSKNFAEFLLEQHYHREQLKKKHNENKKKIVDTLKALLKEMKENFLERIHINTENRWKNIVKRKRRRRKVAKIDLHHLEISYPKNKESVYIKVTV